jgi:hypothetical protein
LRTAADCFASTAAKPPIALWQRAAALAEAGGVAGQRLDAALHGAAAAAELRQAGADDLRAAFRKVR